MPRSSDTRCLYCNGKIPLLQRLKNSQFCSSAHEQTYRNEQQELAIERLHQTHDSLQAYKPPEDVESILGPLSIPPAPTPTARNTIGGIANSGGETQEQKRHKPAKPGSEGAPYDPENPSDFRPSWEKLSGETMYTEEERLAPPRPLAQPSQPPAPSAAEEELSELDQFLRDTAALDKFSSKDLDLDDLAPENLSAPPKPDPSVMRHFMPKQPRPEPEPSRNDFTESLLDRLGVQDSGLSRDLGQHRDVEPPTPEPEPQEEPVAASPLDRLMQAADAPSRPEPEPEEPISVFYTGPEASRMAELLPQVEPEGPYGVLPPATPKPVAAEPAAFGGQDQQVSSGVLWGDVALQPPATAGELRLPMVDDAQRLAGPESQDVGAGLPHQPALEFAASQLSPARPEPVDLETARPDVLSAEYIEELTRLAQQAAQDESAAQNVVAAEAQAGAPVEAVAPVAESGLEAVPAIEPEALVPEPVAEAPEKPVAQSETVAGETQAAEQLAEPAAQELPSESKKPISGIWISEELFGSRAPKHDTRSEKKPAAPVSAADADSKPAPIAASEPFPSESLAETRAEAKPVNIKQGDVHAERADIQPVKAEPEIDLVDVDQADEELAEPVLAEAAPLEAVETEAVAAAGTDDEAVAEESLEHDAAEPEAVEEEVAEWEPSLARLAALLAAEPRDSEPGQAAEADEGDQAEPVSFEREAGLPVHEVEPEAVPVPQLEEEFEQEEDEEPAWASVMPLPGPAAVPALRARRVATEVSPIETEELLIWADLEMTPAVGSQRDLWQLNDSLCALEVECTASKAAGPRAPMTVPLTGTILFPKVRLEPEPFKTTSPGSGMDRMMGPPPRTPGGGSGANRKKRKPTGPGGMLGGVKGFWTHAPRDLKILLLVIPALLALVFHPSLPKISVSAPDTSSGVTADVKGWFDNSWTEVRAAIAGRAGVALEEDFRQGLDQWISRGGATTHWSFDQTGFVKPGPLALYAPSMNLVDYQMQFLGMIDQGALSWVVRAKDFRNYYVVKLTQREGGALPIIFVTRYAVIDGVAMDRVDTRVPIDARADTLYRVRMDIKGDNFTLAVQDQVVDTWEDPRLDRGGVGFYTGRGEESRVRWIQLTHQYDMLGRLCAYLAPYNPSSAAGAEVAGSY